MLILRYVCVHYLEINKHFFNRCSSIHIPRYNKIVHTIPLIEQIFKFRIAERSPLILIKEIPEIRWNVNNWYTTDSMPTNSYTKCKNSETKLPNNRKLIFSSIKKKNSSDFVSTFSFNVIIFLKHSYLKMVRNTQQPLMLVNLLISKRIFTL